MRSGGMMLVLINEESVAWCGANAGEKVHRWKKRKNIKHKQESSLKYIVNGSAAFQVTTISKSWWRLDTGLLPLTLPVCKKETRDQRAK
jgi:hypothetical protein